MQTTSRIFRDMPAPSSACAALASCEIAHQPFRRLLDAAERFELQGREILCRETFYRPRITFEESAERLVATSIDQATSFWNPCTGRDPCRRFEGAAPMKRVLAVEVRVCDACGSGQS